MIPVGLPHGVDPSPSRPLADPLPVIGPVGVQAVDHDLHAPRAASVPVGAPDGGTTRVRHEPPLTPEAAGGAGADAPGAAATGNRAAALSLPLQALLRDLQQLGVVDDLTGVPQAVAWPSAAQPLAADPAAALQVLRQALGQSPWFAAHPRTPSALAGAVRSWSDRLLQEGGEPGLPEGGSAPPDLAASPLPETADSGLVAPGQTGPATTASAGSLQQALQLLRHGQLQWSGELTPGVRCRLQRDDVWEEDPQHPGRLLAGTMLRMVLDLPATGALEVQAQQMGDRLRVRLLPAAGQARCFADALADLQAALVPLAAQPVDLAVVGRVEPGA